MPLPPALAAVLAALALGMGGVFAAAVFAKSDRQPWAGLAVAAVYLTVSGVAAASGALADLDARPPPVALLLVACTVGVFGLAWSRIGDALLRWPLAALVGVQAFRVPVEWFLAQAYGAGAVPAEVTVHGLNFDLATGLLAAPLAVWLWRGTPPRWVVAAWNVLGLALLVTVVALAATSAFGVLDTEPRMTLPATWPGVWLPAWLVQLALLGHLLVLRALRRGA